MILFIIVQNYNIQFYPVILHSSCTRVKTRELKVIFDLYTADSTVIITIKIATLMSIFPKFCGNEMIRLVRTR